MPQKWQNDLNDLRWTEEMIKWSEFLLLLEGQTVHLPRPKNQFSSDLEINRENKLPFFATSTAEISFIGRYNSRDEREDAMMALRWKVFNFTVQIKDPEDIPPCPHCFSVLLSSGMDA